MAYIPPPARSGEHGNDIPTGYVVAYVVVALLVWVGVAVAVALREAAHDHRGGGPVRPPHGEQMFSGVLAGCMAAIAWPLTAVAGGVWLLVRHATRPHASLNEEKQSGTVCAVYQPPATAADSGLCARCGMYDYKHKEPTGA